MSKTDKPLATTIGTTTKIDFKRDIYNKGSQQTKANFVTAILSMK